MRSLLLGIYWRMEARLTPGLRYFQHEYEEILSDLVREGVLWLDVGCGRRILPAWRAEAERRLVQRAGCVVGIDPDCGSLNGNGSIGPRAAGLLARLPFADETFDLVTANMVAEHLSTPEQDIAELARVLRPGGIALINTPNARAHTTHLARLLPEAMKVPLARILEGRVSPDVFPTYYRMNTEVRVREVARAAGLDVERIRGVTSTAEFSIIPPLALLELLWIRVLMRPQWEHRRQSLIITLRKPAIAASTHSSDVQEA